MGKWDTDIKKESRQEFWDIQQKMKVEVAKAKQWEYYDLSAKVKSLEEERIYTGWSNRTR